MAATWNYLATAQGLARYFGRQTKEPGDIWDKGRLAASNAELVKRVSDLCSEFGRRAATAKEARSILKLREAA